MNLYLISQTENNTWDTFDSAVVCAPDEDTARNMNPSDGKPMEKWGDAWSDWASCPENVTVKLIGTAAEGVRQGVVCASFNAG